MAPDTFSTVKMLVSVPANRPAKTGNHGAVQYGFFEEVKVLVLNALILKRNIKSTLKPLDLFQ